MLPNGGLLDQTTLHATCIALDPARGLLILGASGSGKSALALTLMAMGARLVSDDRTIVGRQDSELVATAPDALRGLIEARGLGLLRADPLDRAAVVLVADLDAAETDRLPPHRRIVFCECAIDLVKGPVTPHFPAALMQYLKGGRQA